MYIQTASYRKHVACRAASSWYVTWPVTRGLWRQTERHIWFVRETAWPSTRLLSTTTPRYSPSRRYSTRACVCLSVCLSAQLNPSFSRQHDTTCNITCLFWLINWLMINVIIALKQLNHLQINFDETNKRSASRRLSLRGCDSELSTLCRFIGY